MFKRKSKSAKATPESNTVAKSVPPKAALPVPPITRSAPPSVTPSAAPSAPPSIPPSVSPSVASLTPSRVPSKPSSQAPSKASSIAASEDADGAKPSEILIEASRRNNFELLQEVLAVTNDGSDLSGGELINKSVDALGNTALHISALNGSYECLDMLLDVAGVEVDPINRLEGNTPLHCAVIYAEEEPEHGLAIVDMLLDAGADPRKRNKLKDRPIDLVPASNPELRRMLQGAEMALMMGPREDVEELGQDVDDSGSESD